MKQRYEFPRVTTRGYYDLHTGKQLKSDNGYRLFPKKKFDKIFKAEEIVIFVHGMRNSPKGAVMGGRALQRKLRKLGYKYPVVSFSYDANIRGAHIYSDYDRVIPLAEKIAKRNGSHLYNFIYDLKKKNPLVKIHLVGHSLGCEVIQSALSGALHVNSVHYLGSPINQGLIFELARKKTIGKIVNYINKKDEVIKKEEDLGRCIEPSCIHKVKFNKIVGVINKPCPADNHGFRAYAYKLRSFP